LSTEGSKRTDRPIVFVYTAPLPGPAASSIQTMRMAASTAASARRVLVQGAIDPEMTHDEIRAYYGVPESTIELLASGSYGARGGLRTPTAVFALVRRFGWRWVAHSRTPSMALLTALLGIRTVFEVHSIPISPRQRRLLPLLTRAPGLKRVVVISEALRGTLLDAEPGFRRKELVVAHDGVDTAQFDSPLTKAEARAELGLPQDEVIVGYTGRLTAGKGVHVLLEAAKDAAFTVIVVGGNPGDLSDRRDEYEKQYGSERVRFLGYQPPALIPTYLRAFDVAVAPFTTESISRFTSGGRVVPYDISSVMSPLKMFEYMASGTPFVTSDMPVLREVIKPGKTATVVPPGDAQALRAAIEDLLAHPDEASAIAAAAKQAVRSHTWDARVEKLFGGIG
jgi:glycosyltransferase involved in cell wall biosynthesis